MVSTITHNFTPIGGTVAEISVPDRQTDRKKERIIADLISDRTHAGVAFAR